MPYHNSTFNRKPKPARVVNPQASRARVVNPQASRAPVVNPQASRAPVIARRPTVDPASMSNKPAPRPTVDPASMSNKPAPKPAPQPTVDPDSMSNKPAPKPAPRPPQQKRQEPDKPPAPAPPVVDKPEPPIAIIPPLKVEKIKPEVVTIPAPPVVSKPVVVAIVPAPPVVSAKIKTKIVSTEEEKVITPIALKRESPQPVTKFWNEVEIVPAGTPGAEPVVEYVEPEKTSAEDLVAKQLEEFRQRYGKRQKNDRERLEQYLAELRLAGMPDPVGWQDGEPMWEVTQSENGPVVKGTDVLVVTDTDGKVRPMTAAEMALMQTNAGQGSASGANNGAAVGLIAAALALGLI